MTRRSMHVLVLTSLFPNRPGEKQGNFVLDQVRELTAQGADVTVLVAKPWVPGILKSYLPAAKLPVNAAEYAGESFQVVNAGYFSLPRFALGRFAALFIRGLVPAIEYINEKQPIDLIHAHGLQLGHASVEAAARLRIPSVLTIHGVETAPQFDNSTAKRRHITDTLERATQVVLVGSPLREYLHRYTPKVEHCVVIGNGFTGYPDLAPSSLVPRNHPIRIVAVSNYEESKGFEILLSAIDALEPSYRSKFELVLIGAGVGFEILHEQVERLGLSDTVHYLGPLMHRETMAEILAGDVFCLPSWREAFGIMYAEAMSLGKFTIGCRGQGPSDFIQHLETGYLVEPRSSTSVADALRWVVDNPRHAKSVAERGKTYALGNLTWKQNVTKILSLYRSLTRHEPLQEQLGASVGSTALKV